MLRSYIKYLINRIYYPDLHFNRTSQLKGEIKYKDNCKIGKNCRLYDIYLDNNIIIDDNVFLENVSLGNNVKIYRDCDLYNVSINRYSYIAQRSVISHTNIGAFCSIGRNIHCSGANHPIDFLSTNPVFYSTRKQCGTTFSVKDKFNEFLEIEIGNDVWIGSNAIILGGVKVGNGSIIGAGAVVTQNVAPYSIVVGNPAKLLRFRFDEITIKEIENLSWWMWNDALLLKNLEKFQYTYQNHT